MTSLLTTSWSDLLSRLPASVDLTALAREYGAIQRSRRIGDGETLLRLALWHGPGGMSLRRAAALALGTQIADLSDVALYKRLNGAADWLEAIVSAMLAERQQQLLEQSRPLVLVDGTSLSELGGHGTAWVLHSRYNPQAGFTGFTLSDCHLGETLKLHAIHPGEIVIADRFYGRGPSLVHVLDCKADFVVRAGWNGLAWRDEQDEIMPILPLLASMKAGETRDLWVNIRTGKQTLRLRLVVEARSEEAARAAMEKARRKAKKNGSAGDPRSIEAARYMIIATSLDEHDYPAEQVIAMYRMRWQIELAFKRLKSIMHLGKVPARGARLARTWLYAHLLLALLVDDITQQLLDSPPCA